MLSNASFLKHLGSKVGRLGRNALSNAVNLLEISSVEKSEDFV